LLKLFADKHFYTAVPVPGAEQFPWTPALLSAEPCASLFLFLLFVAGQGSSQNSNQTAAKWINKYDLQVFEKCPSEMGAR
jgi:hypothetical protein